jgi:hypothetical protein
MVSASISKSARATRTPAARACVLAAVGSVALSIGSCATVRPKVEVVLAGDLAPDRAAGVIERARTRSDQQARHVRVVDAAVTKVDVSQYEVVGSVVIAYRSVAEMMGRTFYWTHDYESSTLSAYCDWQTPLKLLTLGAWAMVPIHYPCVR